MVDNKGSYVLESGFSGNRNDIPHNGYWQPVINKANYRSHFSVFLDSLSVASERISHDHPVNFIHNSACGWGRREHQLLAVFLSPVLCKG